LISTADLRLAKEETRRQVKLAKIEAQREYFQAGMKILVQPIPMVVGGFVAASLLEKYNVISTFNRASIEGLIIGSQLIPALIEGVKASGPAPLSLAPLLMKGAA